MLFEIRGKDNQRILESLKDFQSEVEAEYKNEVVEAQKKIKAIQSLTPVPINVPLPDELTMMSFEKDGTVFFRIGLYAPRLIRVLSKGRKAENNLKQFLESRGLKGIRIKWVAE